MTKPTSKILMIKSSLLDAPHGFFTRRGGVSQGLYQSMNCGFGSQDTESHVATNRNRVATALQVKPSRLLTLHQIHSSQVVTPTLPWPEPESPKADAMVTTEVGLALGILTADCAPVLFADTKNRVIGAAHAGWRGALSGIIETTIEHMLDLGSELSHISAAIGPCITQSNYEVGPEFKTQFCIENTANAEFFIPSSAPDHPDHWQFDLPGFVKHRLSVCGITQIDNSCPCTYAAEDRFFSYRRSTHHGEKDYGRNLSAIVLDAQS